MPGGQLELYKQWETVHQSCMSGLPIGRSGLSLGIAVSSGLSIGSLTLLPAFLGGLCISLRGLRGVCTLALQGYSLATGTVIHGHHFLPFLLVLFTASYQKWHIKSAYVTLQGQSQDVTVVCLCWWWWWGSGK